MTDTEKHIKSLNGVIAKLSANQRSACVELADHISHACNLAGPTVGLLALALASGRKSIQLDKAEQSRKRKG